MKSEPVANEPGEKEKVELAFGLNEFYSFCEFDEDDSILKKMDSDTDFEKFLRPSNGIVTIVLLKQIMSAMTHFVMNIAWEESCQWADRITLLTPSGKMSVDKLEAHVGLSLSVL